MLMAVNSAVLSEAVVSCERMTPGPLRRKPRIQVTHVYSIQPTPPGISLRELEDVYDYKDRLENA
jgi:hypothetical protein